MVQSVVNQDRGSLEFAAELANQFRCDSVRMTTAAGSGHPTSSASAADLMAVLLARHLRYDWSNPKRRENDRLIFSKGHASPLLYAMFKAAGVVSDDDLMTKYRRINSILQGHPTSLLPWVDVATGSLGQGFPIGVGLALAHQRLSHTPAHVWVLCGDSEMSEGSIWEAFDKANLFGLSNLTVIVDINRYGQHALTELQWNQEAYARRVSAFGCEPIIIDGHNLRQIDEAFDKAHHSQSPTVILAKTIKGSGIVGVEDAPNWHGKPLPQDMADKAIKALGGVTYLTVTPLIPEPSDPSAGLDRQAREENIEITTPEFEVGTAVATRAAYGKAIVAVGQRPNVVCIDGELGNSTHADDFAEAHPERYFDVGIAEQQMVALAVGLDASGYVPFAATFGAFMSRALDFIRMAAISRANIRLCGSHGGVEIGEDGPSQMGLEDLAALRAIQGSTVLYPSDATSTVKLVELMADMKGVSYIRTTRGKYPTLYSADETFHSGGSKVLRSSQHDTVAIIAAGVTVHNALEAAKTLDTQGISVRVIDAYSIKPVDNARLAEAVNATSGRLVVVEDHYPEGGLGSAVLESLAAQRISARVTHLAVRELPGSGKPPEQMEAAGIAADNIVSAVQALQKEP